MGDDYFGVGHWHDLAQLEHSCRSKQIKLRGACESVLDGLSATAKSKDLLSPAEQMFVGCLRQILQEKRRRDLSVRKGKDYAARLKWEFGNANESLKHVHGGPLQNSRNLPAAELACRRNGLVGSVPT